MFLVVCICITLSGCIVTPIGYFVIVVGYLTTLVVFLFHLDRSFITVVIMGFCVIEWIFTPIECFFTLTR